MIIAFERILKGPISSACILILLIFGLYYESINNSFQYDDKHSIVENPHIRSLDNVPLFWLHPEYFSRDPENAMFRPMVLSSLAFNYAISGYDEDSYHLLNILVHAVCCYLVFSLLLLLGIDRKVAQTCVMFLAIHPLCSQSVNYISSRSELLTGMGSVGALWAYVRYNIERVRIWYVVSIVFYAFALFSKSIAIMFPLWIIAYDLQTNRGFSLKRYSPYLFASIGYLFFTGSLLIRAVYNEPVRELSVQFATQCKALIYYLYLIFFPVRQNIDHAFFESSYTELAVMLTFMLLCSGLIFLFRRRSYLVGSVVAISPLIPTFVVPLNVLINENRLYIPLIGICILIAVFCTNKKHLFRREMMAVLAVSFIFFTSQRNTVWSNEYSLWYDANRKNPFSLKSFIYLGHELRKMKEFDRSLVLFEKALELEPNNSIARAGLALALQQNGSLEDALDEYLRTLRENSEMNDLNHNIGFVLQLMQRYEESLAYYKFVNIDSPHLSLSLNNSGTIYEKMDMPDSALYYYKRGYQFGSSDAKKNLERLNKKIIYDIESALESKQWNKAEDLSRGLIDSFGNHQLGRFYLVISLFEQSRFVESLNENVTLVTNYPNFIQGLLQYANVLETMKDFPKAIQIYSKLLKKPIDVKLRNMVEVRLSRVINRGNS